MKYAASVITRYTPIYSLDSYCYSTAYCKELDAWLIRLDKGVCRTFQIARDIDYLRYNRKLRQFIVRRGEQILMDVADDQLQLLDAGYTVTINTTYRIGV